MQRGRNMHKTKSFPALSTRPFTEGILLFVTTRKDLQTSYKQSTLQIYKHVRQNTGNSVIRQMKALLIHPHKESMASTSAKEIFLAR